MKTTLLLTLSSLFCTTLLAASSPGQLLIAHRGASRDAPENTLAAFRLAWEQGADGVEGDFCLSKDGKIVCMHDARTKRTGDRDLRVAEATLEELKQLDVGSWKGEQFRGECIPTLAEVLAVIPPGKKLFLEVKCGPDIVPVIAEELKNSALLPEQVAIICFNARVIDAARKQLPAHKAHLLMGFEKDKETQQWKPAWEDVKQALAKIAASGIDAAANLKVLSAERLAELRKAGFEIHCYTVNDGKHAQKLQTLGVDSITTDRPAHLRKWLSEEGQPIAF
jgi:glycerophosphoryl diester phosphodiesterase